MKVQIANDLAIKKTVNQFEQYAKETGRSIEETIKVKGRDVTFKLRQEFKKAQPREVPDGTAFRGFNIRVRDQIREKIKSSEDFKGVNVRRTINGRKTRNKRAIAVHQELKKRASSRGYLAHSIAIWNKNKNKVHTDGVLATKHTRGRKFEVGEAIGLFNQDRQRLTITSRSSAAFKLDRERRLIQSAFRASQLDTIEYLAARQTRNLLKSLK